MRRHGADSLPHRIDRRRIYILPTRFGLLLAGLLCAMLLAGLNYNSNLGLAFTFLMIALALVAMHHCHRNLLGLVVDAPAEADALAGGDAPLEVMLANDSGLHRYDVDVRWDVFAETRLGVPPGARQRGQVALPARRRGILRLEQFELRTEQPLGWFRAWTYVHAPLTLYVAPAPDGNRPLPANGTRLGHQAQGEASGEEEFAGLRTYVPGTPLKHLAWKTLARGGDAAAKSYSGRTSQPEWLDWSALDGLDAEARLAQLCRWVLECAAADLAYGLRLPGRQLGPARGATHRRDCLRALASHPAGLRP